MRCLGKPYQEDVGGFEVKMDNVLAVQEGQAASNIQGNALAPARNQSDLRVLYVYVFDGEVEGAEGSVQGNGRPEG